MNTLSAHAGTPPVAQALLEFTGQTPGNLIAVLHNGVVIGSAVFSEDEPRPAPPDVVRAIEAQAWPDAPPRTEKMGSLGSYRMDCGFEGPDTLVVGVSLNLANRIIARKNITTTALVASALLVTAALTVWVVGYTLRPLRRVAATAAEVAAMPLTDDDHRIGARVAPQDTDPDNEVGIVGNTLNRLLDNVDSALAHRADSDLRMRQFIADASHELRTPLAAIQGYAELTRQDSSALPPTTEYALARIESEARRMALARRRAAAALPAGRRRRSADRRRRPGRCRHQRGKRCRRRGPDPPLDQRPARRAGVGAWGSCPAAPAGQQSAQQRAGAHAARRHGDDGNHPAPQRPRRALRGTDGR